MNMTVQLVNNDPIMTLRVLRAELEQVGDMAESQQWLQTTEGQNFLSVLFSTIRDMDPAYQSQLAEVAELCA